MASSHPFIHRSPDLQHLRKDGFGERAAGGVINLMGCCVGPTPLCSLEEDTGTHRSQGTPRKDHVGTREVAVRKARGKAAGASPGGAWVPAIRPQNGEKALSAVYAAWSVACVTTALAK